ncbi:hypothetical protein T459_13147 [Capsicum annuum]|uniref:BOS complex subunit TMEM147 n=1 Tax=Capsicum annuum TaxID=4072 RepID=A0A2G2ZRX0_CAPAN|nr:hypothetical protein T459_13147 [Capsicum annuum]
MGDYRILPRSVAASLELLKALIWFIDVVGLYFALTQLTQWNISQNDKFQAVGLGWYASVLPELLRLLILTGELKVNEKTRISHDLVNLFTLMESNVQKVELLVKLLSCDLEVTGSSLGNSLWQKCKVELLTVLHRLAPLWVAARGLEFTWDYVLQRLDANVNLVKNILK